MAELLQSELEQFVALDKRRLSLSRQIDTLERQQKPLKDKIKAFVAARGGSDHTTTRFGFVLRLLRRAGTVRWKDAFIERAGGEAAQKLQDQAEPTFLLQVEPEA